MGYATRYWDCCRPSGANNGAKVCGADGVSGQSSGATSACAGGSAYACYDYIPKVSSSNPCISYAFAAFNGAKEGTCFQLNFTGTESHGGGSGSAMLKGKELIVQIINTGNINSGQFDLQIPGGGVGQFNACSTQWNLPNTQSVMGTTYGGFLAQCESQSTDYNTQKACVTSMCSKLPSALQAGCAWFTGWYEMADNPDVVYQQLSSCPSELTQISGLQ